MSDYIPGSPSLSARLGCDRLDRFSQQSRSRARASQYCTWGDVCVASRFIAACWLFFNTGIFINMFCIFGARDEESQLGIYESRLWSIHGDLLSNQMTLALISNISIWKVNNTIPAVKKISKWRRWSFVAKKWASNYHNNIFQLIKIKLYVGNVI
jgi:hypothetical protein